MLISKGISLKDKKQPGKSRNISLFFSMAYIVLFLLLLFCSLFPSHLKEPQPQKVSIQSEWQMDGQPVSLPLYLDGLSPRTLVTLTAQMRINPGDSLYLKTVYAPLQVFADGELIFEYGKPGSFQKFWLDPPTKTALIPLPFKGGTVTLTMCFESPSQRNTLALHPVITGPSAAVWEYLFSEMGFSLFFSIVLIALGVILCLIAFILTRFEQTGISFFWLGLFALCVGIWILGECNLTGLFIQNPVLLYVMAFGGLFTLSVPLLRFIQVVLELPRHKLLNGMLFLMRISLCAAFLLQVSGVASLSKTLYFFHVLILLFFCLLCGLVWSEAIRHKSIAARRLYT